MSERSLPGRGGEPRSSGQLRQAEPEQQESEQPAATRRSLAEQVAERVYGLLRDELRLERERQGRRLARS